MTVGCFLPKPRPCPTTPSAICSASRPSARATGRRSAAWSTAARRGSRSTAADIQAELDRRRPGQSRFTTQRREPDEVKILSGVFADERTGRQVTTGTPIALLIENVDQRSKDYSEIKRHATGPATPTTPTTSNTASATIAAAGARRRARPRRGSPPARSRARSLPGVTIRGALVQMGPHAIDRAQLGLGRGAPQPVLLPRRGGGRRSTQSYLDGLRKDGSSIGAVIEIVAEGVPPGLGAPVYGKLDADLAAALMSINAVKGVEIGDGFAAAALRGEENADEMRPGNAGRADVPVEPRRRHPRRHLDRPAGRLPLRRQADLVDPDAARDASRDTARRPRSRPRAATTPASASAPCRSARRWWPACSPTMSCAIAARSEMASPGRFG